MKRSFSFCFMAIFISQGMQVFAATNSTEKIAKKVKKSQTTKVATNHNSKSLEAPALETTSTLPAAKAESAYTGTNNLGDLQYMPRKGEMNAAIEISTRPASATVSSKGKDIFNLSESNLVQEYKFKYGIFDKFLAGVSIEHYITGERVTQNNQQGKSTTTKANGLVDPTFFGTYRIGTQSANKMNMDITLAVSPAFIKAEEGTKDKTGSVGRGATLTFGKFDLGGKYSGVDVNGGFGIYVVGQKEVKDLENGEKFYIDNDATMDLHAYVRREFTDLFAMKGGAELTFVPEETRSFQGQTFYKMDGYNRFGFLGEGQFSIIPEKLLTKFQIRIETDGSRTLTANGSKLDIDTSDSQTFMLGAEFLF